MSARLDDLGALLRAGKAVNSALELSEVLDTILETALGLFDGASGSIMLLEDAEALTVASARGNVDAVGVRSRLGDGIAGHVARTREPVLVNGPADAAAFPGYRPRRRHAGSAMCVPLLHRDALVGVLNVAASGTHTFTGDDLELLSLFAEHAASGVAHARVHAEERARIDEMVRLEQMKTDFITGVSHDLRTPLTSIVGCTSVARRPDLTPEQRDEVLVIAETQAQKLSAMVERMLMSAELGVDPNPAVIAPFDAVEVVRAVAAAHLDAGRFVGVSVEPGTPRVLGDADRLAQVVELLLENAFRHGAPPVEIDVRTRGTRVAVTVLDRGRGVPEADRERVFERFVRLDASRGMPGVGLGLSIVRGLVGTMGATVAARSVDGAAAFTVELVTASASAPLRLVAG
ncbi:MAG TPA: GAF domain-containing sensor histidine kinase [Mycobacteriales bacterium]|jgi:two-component system sensor histidine kinase KdpD